MPQVLPSTPGPRIVPPLKIQGIKTKLLPFILESLRWSGRGTWVEPFLGSGAVLLNLGPDRALVGDSNPHIVRFFRGIQSGQVTSAAARDHLEREGKRLAEIGEAHYYDIRERFNATGASLDFLFLNRSCFNGVMRFNRSGGFNVPFCRKPERFSRALVTKICNQIDRAEAVIKGRPWHFVCGDWRELLEGRVTDDFIYLDPPYVGRHTDYFRPWSETDAEDLAARTKSLDCGVALSMWRRNRFRENGHLDRHWGHLEERTTEHFYHVGSHLGLRHAVVESLRARPHCFA
ncbi:MAG: Dam family site-specific DNA-(adenine-N6)-methyltransferase [Planctomycetes bacterium]|nr:Dam family site-specific DNA-(adenine-N6)-methyltransferase [Planctomycetota bacterium]